MRLFFAMDYINNLWQGVSESIARIFAFFFVSSRSSEANMPNRIQFEVDFCATLRFPNL